MFFRFRKKARKHYKVISDEKSLQIRGHKLQGFFVSALILLMQKRRDSLVKDKRNQAVDAGFDYIETDDERHQGPYSACRHTHKDGGDDHIGADHDDSHGAGACREGDHRSLFRFMFPVDAS